MNNRKQKFKGILRYHRLIVLSIVFSYILYKYSSTETTDKYSNGQVKQEGRNEGGFNEGRWIWYYENRQKQMEGYFERGKRQGKWRMWNEQGKLMTERNYINDKLNGAYTDWNVDGTKKSEGIFSNDKIVR